jgi:D-glycero-alpha-D-manno-heptose-7-phosphate kinase
MTASAAFRCSAPVRLDLAGGWTDVAPFAADVGGVVVNAAINLRVTVELAVGGTGYQLISDDLGLSHAYDSIGDFLRDDALPLLKAAVRRSDPGPCTLHCHCDVPPGSGLGTSGALGVALLAALDRARGVQRTPAQLAEDAFQAESVDAAHPGGRQDQFAGAFGGFNRFTFHDTNTRTQQLKVDDPFARHLADRLILCYTGQSRVSGNTIARVMNAFRAGDRQVVDALHRLVVIAEQMAEALVKCDARRVGTLLTENWREQQRLDTGMQTADMAKLEEAMEAAGAIGAKATGAGAGGSMMFLIDGPRERAIRAAESVGAQVLPFGWTSTGVTVESC